LNYRTQIREEFILRDKGIDTGRASANDFKEKDIIVEGRKPFRSTKIKFFLSLTIYFKYKGHILQLSRSR
jgi:hypothetical protein